MDERFKGGGLGSLIGEFRGQRGLRGWGLRVGVVVGVPMNS